jgi:hypothetical protein
MYQEEEMTTVQDQGLCQESQTAQILSTAHEVERLP